MYNMQVFVCFWFHIFSDDKYSCLEMDFFTLFPNPVCTLNFLSKMKKKKLTLSETAKNH